MVRKLPRNIGDRRSREVDRWLNTAEDRQGSVSRPRSLNEPVYPPLSAFYDLLKREARIACNPITSSRPKDEDKKEEPQRRARFGSNYKNKPVGTSSFASGSSELKNNTTQRKAERKPSESCPLCKSPHNLDDCDKFAKMCQTERMDVIKSNGLCLSCLKYGHMKKDCRIRKVCKSCNGFHPTSLHVDTPKHISSRERTRCEKRKQLQLALTYRSSVVASYPRPREEDSSIRPPRRSIGRLFR